MANPDGVKSTSAPAPARTKKAVEPSYVSLSALPSTPEELFRALALTVTAQVMQPDPAGKKARKQEYALPWAGFTSWHDARTRLDYFEKNSTAKIGWAPFNDTVANDGPMSLNAYPGRALIERVTNEGDACLEAKASEHGGEMPKSPSAAVALWYGLGPGALATGIDDEAARELARKTVTVTGFVGDTKDHKDSIFDSRDFGIGLTAAEMPKTILSLNRGNKKSKVWLTGKHGQGASSTYQYSDLTLIASRRIGAKAVAFTLVEARWDAEDGVMAKTPTYRYLVVDGQVPEVLVDEAEFPAGTLVRHIGYNAADLSSALGENSLYGLLMRSLAEPLFPVWLEMYSLKASGKAQGLPTFRGYRMYGRLIRGTVNALERAWEHTKTTPVPPADGADGEEERAAGEPDAGEEDTPVPEDEGGSTYGTRILHRASEDFILPSWDYGARTGVGELGRVKINYWVADPANRKKKGPRVRDWRDVLKNWVDPDKTVIMTLDGQTHAEESRSIITGAHGAKLWAVGKYMVVQIDCNGLDPRAKYEMFTSTREHAKETPIKKMILEELVRRLSFDTKLGELNVQLAAADIKAPEDKAETISSLIKQYLKAAGISFDQVVRKVKGWVEVDEEREEPVTKRELAPIPAVEPPTFIRWKFAGTVIKMHPGQRYSFLFETDAQPKYWDLSDPAASKIKVTAHGVRYVGGGEMKGGRVRCHFECPADAAVGTKGFIQAQLDYTVGAALTATVAVEVIEKPKPKDKPPGPKPGETEPTPDPKGEAKKTITVKVRKKDFTTVEIPIVTPQPVKMTDTAWATLGWPHDPGKVGFSIQPVGGNIKLYYNVEFPPFLDMKRQMSKKSLESEFIRRYEIKLVLHTIFTLNYDIFDEDEFEEAQKVRVRNILAATAESLALATKSELEIEAKIKSEDVGAIETIAAAAAPAAPAPTEA